MPGAEMEAPGLTEAVARRRRMRPSTWGPSGLALSLTTHRGIRRRGLPSSCLQRITRLNLNGARGSHAVEETKHPVGGESFHPALNRLLLRGLEKNNIFLM